MKVKPAMLAGIIAVTATTSAFAWTAEADDGRKINSVQINRDGAACYVMVGNNRNGFSACMRAKGYIVHACNGFGFDCN
jgi:hypothetical protein